MKCHKLMIINTEDEAEGKTDPSVYSLWEKASHYKCDGS